ncbi:type II toxin-antitoxin system HigB family toxin [Stenotrophomonas maltophilia]|nr:type II toxin-antitoxin system HigB family toxin [Stenotrophomonas maltophilia]
MRLLGKQKLHGLISRHPDIRSWASGWASEIATANWKRPADVRTQFPRARETEPGTFAFPVAEMPIAVVLAVAFPQGIALIKDLINRDDQNGR